MNRRGVLKLLSGLLPGELSGLGSKYQNFYSPSIERIISRLSPLALQRYKTSKHSHSIP